MTPHNPAADDPTSIDWLKLDSLRAKATEGDIVAQHKFIVALVNAYPALRAMAGGEGKMLARILDFPCERQFEIATRIAANVGYVLRPDEPQIGGEGWQPTDDELMAVLRAAGVCQGTRKQLTYVQWKDGIDIDFPTVDLKNIVVAAVRAALPKPPATGAQL